MTKLLTLLAALVLAVGLGTAPSPAQAAVAAETSTVAPKPVTPAGAQQAEAKAGYPRRCRYFFYKDSSSRYELCVKVLYRMKQDDKLIYSHFIENPDRRGNVDGGCISKTIKTFRWGGSISATVEGSAWVFAKISATATASFDKTRTSEVSVSANFTVPPRTTKYCYYVERHEQYMTEQCYQNTYTHGRQCTRKVFYAPAREGWVVTKDPVRY